MFLTEAQEQNESKEVVNDLFGNISISDVRPAIAKMSQEKRDELISKINGHITFYDKISKEEPRGNNFRILTAKLRCDHIYPQLLELLKS